MKARALSAARKVISNQLIIKPSIDFGCCSRQFPVTRDINGVFTSLPPLELNYSTKNFN
jgi:hypothetical protein